MAPYFWTVVDKQSRSHSFTGAQHVVNMVLRALHDGIADISGSMRIAASVPAGGSGISPGPRASAVTWIRCGHWRSWAHFASRRVLSLRWSSYTFIEAHAGAQKSDAVNSFLASPSQRKFPGRLVRILSAYGAWVCAVACIAADFARRNLEAPDAIRAAERRVESVHAAIRGSGVGQLERSTQEPGLDRHVDLPPRVECGAAGQVAVLNRWNQGVKSLDPR